MNEIARRGGAGLSRGGERETQKSQSIRRDKQRGKGGGGIEGASELRVVDGFFFRSFPFGPRPRRSTS